MFEAFVNVTDLMGIQRLYTLTWRNRRSGIFYALAVACPSSKKLAGD